MVPHLGSIKNWHFQHLDLETCGYETHLHRLGKELLYRIYRSCLDEHKPFELKLPETVRCTHFKQTTGVCCKRETTHSFDLTHYFDQVALEASVGEFVADVLLSQSDGPAKLLLEVAVTHACELAKVASGIRILEIKLENDADARALAVPCLDATDPRITTHNHKTLVRQADDCGGTCDRAVRVFTVHRSGKAHLSGPMLQAQAARPPRSQPLWRRVIPAGIDSDLATSWDFQSLVRGAYEEGVAVRNCFLCRSYGTSWEPGHVHCRRFRRDVRTNQAAECDRFSPARRGTVSEPERISAHDAIAFMTRHIPGR